MRAPDVLGSVAKAWKLNRPKQEPGSEKKDGQVAGYVVEGPFHPFWNRWLVVAVHLREEPGLPAPIKKSEKMTHEFFIYSMDPKHELTKNLDPDNPSFGGNLLSPPDTVVQFEADSDDQVAKIVDQAVALMCAGQASPDSDYRSWWETAIPNSVEHARFGGHGAQFN